MSARAEFYFKGRRLLDKPYHLRAIGLPNVYLLNGVFIEHDADYGTLITIEDIPGLHHAVGLYVVTKSDELTGSEFGFLRKEMHSRRRRSHNVCASMFRPLPTTRRAKPAWAPPG